MRTEWEGGTVPPPGTAAWWSPRTWIAQWQARRAAQKAIRKVIWEEQEHQALEFLKFRADHVRIVRVTQGKSEVFEVQYRYVLNAEWLLARKSYSIDVAEWDAARVANHLWTIKQPKHVKVIG